MYRHTWLAVVVTLALTFPAQFAGAIARYFFELAVLPDHEGGPLNWLTGDWYQTIARSVFPDLTAGIVVGVLSIVICSKVFRRANYRTVMYVVGGVVASFCVLGLAAFAMTGKLNLPSLCNGIGAIIGLQVGRAVIAEDAAKDLLTRAETPKDLP